MQAHTGPPRITGRRGDFTNALVVVGVTAAVVIAVVAPVSRGVRPSTLLEDAAMANVAAPGAEVAVPRTVRSSSRPGRASSPVGGLLNLASVEQAASCIPCIATGTYTARIVVGRPAVAAEKRPMPTAAPGGVASEHADAGAAADAPPSTSAAEPAVGAPTAPAARTSPRPADRRAEPAGGAAGQHRPDRPADGGVPPGGRPDSAPAATAADDRSRNDARNDAPKQNGKNR